MPVAKLIAPTTKQEISKLRVAAYCRVSSNSADQRNSFATQEHVYTKYMQKWRGITLNLNDLEAKIRYGKEVTVHFDPQTICVY